MPLQDRVITSSDDVRGSFFPFFFYGRRFTKTCHFCIMIHGLSFLRGQVWWDGFGFYGVFGSYPILYPTA